MQVKANSVSVVYFCQLMFQPPVRLDWKAWTVEVLSRPKQLLRGLCDALGASLDPQLLPHRAMLCMLLSAVTAGQSGCSAGGDRSQVRQPWTGKAHDTCTLFP